MVQFLAILRNYTFPVRIQDRNVMLAAWPAAARGFTQAGRGALVIDTNTLVRGEMNSGNPMFYLAENLIAQHGWADVVRMVRSYDPSWELVTVLLKKNRETAYRISVPSERKSASEGTS